MKQLLLIALCFGLMAMGYGCAPAEESAQIVATTLPVYEFTSALCEGTGITVTRLVTEEVSCLHDYSLQTRQMRAIEGAELVVISGGGLEDFLADILTNQTVIDTSQNVAMHHGHEHEGHNHENDPHIWLSPTLAKSMVHNICHGLMKQYPQFKVQFSENEAALLKKLDELATYGQAQLQDLSCKELITFHDGFAYLAEEFGLTIIRAVEGESGSEASAKELIELIELVHNHDLPAIFTERSGSVSAAQIIAAETGVTVYSLDMAMAGDSYFDAMYHNIDILKEALK